MKMDVEPKSVSEFYKGQNVFITGATGFMGKVLVEKLLWSCGEIGNIYILLRSKKGVSLEDRLSALIGLPVFDRIRTTNPGLFAKIKPIFGDIYETNLGISCEDRAILEERVSVIFHVAASVRFDDPMKKAILLNVRATRDVMELAKRTRNLKVVSYVSTCYSNCENSVIKEEVYPSDYNWRLMIELAENIDENILNILQPKMLKTKPNTYTFSKQLAENVVKDYSAEIPSIIFRPSIVVHSLEEPFRGWIDSFNGPAGLIAGAVTGVIHTLFLDIESILDLMPCDYSIRGLISTTCFKGNSDSKECQVFNCASGNKKEITQRFFLDFIRFDRLHQMPAQNMLWYPAIKATKYKTLFYLMTMLTHVLPALLIDSILRIKGLKFSLLRLYRKIYTANQSLSYFMLNNWKIYTENYYSVMKQLSASDAKTFNFDVGTVDEEEARILGYYGVRRYLLKEDMGESTTIKMRSKYLKFYYAHQIFKLVFIAFLSHLTYTISSFYILKLI